MSFRIEEKLLIDSRQIIDFENFLLKKEAKELFPPRKIKSLYFENSNEEMYKDSLEGIVPRKKIRVRNYPNSNDLSFYLEIKISSVEGRYKTRKLMNKNEFEKIKKLGIYDKQYGTCRPVIYVTYNRNYYKLNDIRICVDKNIEYTLFSGKKLYSENNTIVELKTAINKDSDDLIEIFPFKRTRFSKYCEGISNLNKGLKH